jgi:hypothetical protein
MPTLTLTYKVMQDSTYFRPQHCKIVPLYQLQALNRAHFELLTGAVECVRGVLTQWEYILAYKHDS